MIIFLLFISLFLTYIIPTSIFSKVESWSVFWMIYFFMFKAIASIVIFYAFALGKNFNKAFGIVSIINHYNGFRLFMCFLRKSY